MIDKLQYYMMNQVERSNRCINDYLSSGIPKPLWIIAGCRWVFTDVYATHKLVVSVAVTVITQHRDDEINTCTGMSRSLLFTLVCNFGLWFLLLPLARHTAGWVDCKWVRSNETLIFSLSDGSLLFFWHSDSLFPGFLHISVKAHSCLYPASEQSILGQCDPYTRMLSHCTYLFV